MGIPLPPLGAWLILCMVQMTFYVVFMLDSYERKMNSALNSVSNDLYLRDSLIEKI